jgi:hypothetical protein
MIESSQYIHYYKILPNGLVVWHELIKSEITGYYRFGNLERSQDKVSTYAGEMTQHSKRRLSKALNLLLEIAVKKKVKNPSNGKSFYMKLAFQTLTLSAAQTGYTDKEIKKLLLEPYIRIMRRNGQKNYIWKAEQQRNGNIHFHILTDTWIDYTIIRDTWNNLQSKLGFISDFEKRHGHRDPNSTDVKAVTKERETLSYLKKYMLKDSDKSQQLRHDKDYTEKAKGKVWDCSKNLKLKNKEFDIISDHVFREIKQMEKDSRTKVITDDFFTFYCFGLRERKKYFSDETLSKFNAYIQQVKEH